MRQNSAIFFVQSVTGSWTFNQDVTANTVLLTKLQNEDFNALKAKFVYRGGEDAITFTGSNTFENGLQISEASTFAAEKLAFGADVSSKMICFKTRMTAF